MTALLYIAGIVITNYVWFHAGCAKARLTAAEDAMREVDEQSGNLLTKYYNMGFDAGRRLGAKELTAELRMMSVPRLIGRLHHPLWTPCEYVEGSADEAWNILSAGASRGTTEGR